MKYTANEYTQLSYSGRPGFKFFYKKNGEIIQRVCYKICGESSQNGMFRDSGHPKCSYP